MKSVLRVRHYCDFCKKSTGTRKSMEKHEGSCTANPDRVCRMCVYGQLIQQPMADLVKTNIEKGWKAMAALAEGCPACILAADRQTPWPDWESLPEQTWKETEARMKLDDRNGWDYTAASKAFLEEHRPEPAYGGY